MVISPRAVMADAAAAAVDIILARRAWAVVARDNDRDDNGKGGDPPVPSDDAASGGGDDVNASSRMRSGGGTAGGGGGGHHRRNDDDAEEGGHIIAGTTTTMDTNAATIAVGTTPRGEGRGVRGWWRCRAGDRGRASTLAIVVAVSVVDIGSRLSRPSSRPLTSGPSSWPSQLLTWAVVDVGHPRGRQRVGQVVGGVWQKGEAQI